MYETIPLFVILIILVHHFYADFFYQSDSMAKGKSKSNKILFQHGLVYTLFMACAALTLSFLGYTILELFLWAILNGAAHVAVDYVTSRLSSNAWTKGETHKFFVIIGLDQMIHMFVLFSSFVVLTNLL